jgi:RNA polymerase sigma factor (sigma-70 family)
MTDLELLAQYGRTKEPGAFAELVRRHVDWVYSASMRQVRDRQLAEDVTQAVFIALAQKAASLHGDRPLSSWLMTVTRRAAINAVRSESRRRRHEQEAAVMRQEPAVIEPKPAWEEIAPVLDEQVLRLKQKDRDAVMLRFYERRSFAEVGVALGISEEAARKRVDRAVEQLRARLAQKGVTIGAGALAGVVSDRLVEQAPEGLAQSAVAGGGAATGAGVIAKGALGTMTWMKVKVAVIVAVVSVLTGVALVATGPLRAPAPVAATIESVRSQPEVKGDRAMRGQINFPYPFSGFNHLTFINCYASVYMHLEGIVGVDQNSTAKKQEDYYFIMDTMSGRSADRRDFEDTSEHMDDTPETIDFLMGLTGYTYRTVREDLPAAIKASIDSGKPVLARVKDESNGAFRVLIGYDGDALVMADPKGAQRKPTTPAYADIAEAIIITGKTQPRYTFLDALRRIQTVMVKSRDARIWDQYIEQLSWERLKKADFEEIRRRYKRIAGISWYNFNCHNFAETFRHQVWEPLKDPRLDEVRRQIDKSYDNSHTRNWQVISLHDCRDWSKRPYGQLEWGYSATVVGCLEKLRDYDAEVLAAIERAIAILETDSVQ